MSTKFSDIINLSSLNSKLQRMDQETIEKLFSLKCEVTEKIDGENFRVGIDEKGKFIGQRNNMFRVFEEHPNWNKFSRKTEFEIQKIIYYIRGLKTGISKNKYKMKNITFFGELHGNGLQNRFHFPFDGLNVIWYDVKVNDEYLCWNMKSNWFDSLSLDTPPFVGKMTIKEAFNLDIESMESQIADDKFIEGVVITPLDMSEADWWRFPSRLILKYKTKRFSEQKKGKHKKAKPENNFVSEFVDFVTEERIEHAIQHLREQDIEIFYDMKDCQYIPKAVIADIEKEENEGEPLSKEHRKYLGSYIPKFYKKMLEDKVKEQM